MYIFNRGVALVLNASDKEACVDFLTHYDWQECLKHSSGVLIFYRLVEEEGDHQQKVFERRFVPDSSSDNPRVIRKVIANACRRSQSISLPPNLSYEWAEGLLDVDEDWRIIRSQDYMMLFWDRFTDETGLLLPLRHLVPGTYWWVDFSAAKQELVEAGSFISWLSQQDWTRAIIIRGGLYEIRFQAVSTSWRLLQTKPELQETLPAVVLRTKKNMLLSLDHFRAYTVYLPENDSVVIAVDPSSARGGKSRCWPFGLRGDKVRL